jgi:formylmethanofuran dehydrogenase subunit E
MKSFEDAVKFHGHSCGGLAIGWKVAEYVTELLGLSFSEDEELVCIAETDSCTVDAIQVSLGCTAGKGNLFVNKWGKTAFSFYNRKTGKSVRLVAIPDSVPKPAEMAELREVVFSGKATEAEHARYDELSDMYVAEILATPAEKLFEVKETTELVPMKARIYENVICSVCGEQTADGLCGVIDGKLVCIPCMRGL